MAEFLTWVGDAFTWTMGALAALAGMAGAFASGFVAPGETVFNGYIEADYVYIAATNAGRINDISIDEGQTVTAGQILFTLDDDQYRASLSAARAQQAAAEATWKNLETGSRFEEIAVTRASLAEAEANQVLAKSTLERNLKLQKNGLVPEATVDSARAAYETASAAVTQLQAKLTVQELPARPEELAAAKANFDAAVANVDFARVQLDERTVASPVGGVVDRVYYRSGEVVTIGSPVLSILPPSKVKVEFYIPEPVRNQYRIGDVLMVTCDSCTHDMTATITYLASQPQNTPPIIYSRDERRRLVFLAEAKLDDGVSLLPGQPVSMKVPE